MGTTTNRPDDTAESTTEKPGTRQSSRSLAVITQREVDLMLEAAHASRPDREDLVLMHLSRIVAAHELAAVEGARNEISGMLDGFPAAGRHTRARWAVAWLDEIIARRKAAQ